METSTDAKDNEILSLLLKDSSLTKKQIARKLSLPLTTVHNRIKKMEQAGVIRGYHASADWKKLGFDLCAIVSITVKYETKAYSQDETAKTIRALSGVEWVGIVAGTTDIIAKVRKKDSEDLNDFLLNRLRKVAGVDTTTTIVVLKEYA